MAINSKYRRIAAQLRCPSGVNAVGTANDMNRRNRTISLAAIDSLHWEKGDRVLEIGPGNGAFVGEILKKAEELVYAGIDLSKSMISEANDLNAELVASGHASFIAGNSNNIPFEPGQFDKVISVNTIYFWINAFRDLSEIKRVLKKSGKLCLAFASKSFMKTLPFTEYGFTLYDQFEAELLLMKVGFDIKSSELRTYHGEGAATTGIIEKDMIIIIAEK